MRRENVVRGLAIATIVLAGFAAGCAQEAGPTTERNEKALRGGCHWDCPKCRPNQVICSMRPCVLKCPPRVQPCGDNVCTHGQVCCNASCGICTDPGGFCTQQACAPANSCQIDSDCRTYSNYCDGCACDPLHVNDPDPLCGGTIVQCFADPCGNQTAVCNQSTGQCELAGI